MTLPAAITALSPTFAYVPAQGAVKPSGGTPAAGDTIGTLSDLSASSRAATATSGNEGILRGVPGSAAWAEMDSAEGGGGSGAGKWYTVGGGSTAIYYYAALVRSRNAQCFPGRDPRFWNTTGSPVGVATLGSLGYPGLFTANTAAYHTDALYAPRAAWRNGIDLSAGHTFSDTSDWHIQEWSCSAQTENHTITLGMNIGTFISAMDLAGVVCLGSDPTDAQRLAVRQYLASTLRWVNVNFFGNSRFASGPSLGVTLAQSLPALVRAGLVAADPSRLWGLYANGDPGAAITTAGNPTNALTTLLPTNCYNLRADAANADVVCVTEAFNQAAGQYPAGTGTDAAAAAGVFSTLKAFCLGIKAQGFKVVYGTEFSAVNSPRPSWDAVGGVRQQLQSLILADNSFYDGLVRQDLIPCTVGGVSHTMGDPGLAATDSAHDVWYDAIHLAPAGQALVSPYWVAAILGLLAPAGGGNFQVYFEA